jgi:hypothetical protein
MQLPDPTQLTKLIKLCRKLGILHVKCGEFEFTLDETPAKKARRAKKWKPIDAPTEEEKEDQDLNGASLSSEELLMWSVGSLDKVLDGESQGNDV